MKLSGSVITLLLSLAIQINVAQAQAPKAEPPKAQSPSVPQTGGASLAGQIDESVANRLSIGMSDTEVLTLAGPPRYPEGGNLQFASRWVYVVGDQAVELSFGSGRIVEIKRLTPQPGIVR